MSCYYRQGWNSCFTVLVVGLLVSLSGCAKSDPSGQERDGSRVSENVGSYPDLVLACPVNFSDALLDGSISDREQLEEIALGLKNTTTSKGRQTEHFKASHAEITLGKLKFNGSVTYFGSEIAVVNYSSKVKERPMEDFINTTYFVDLASLRVDKVVTSMMGTVDMKTSVRCKAVNGDRGQ